MTQPSGTFSAGLTTGADFLMVSPGARPDALGQAYSALAGDLNVLPYNPAGLGVLRMPEAGYSRFAFVEGVQFDFLAAALPLGKPGVVGLAYQGVRTEPFNSTADTAAAPVSASEQMVLLGFGRSFGRLQAGLSVKRLKRDLDGWGKGSGFADVGVRWIPARRWSVAAVASHLGPLFSRAEGTPYPSAWRTGACYRLLEDVHHSVDLVSEGFYQPSNREARVAAGAEYWYLERYAVRAGWALDSCDSQQEGPSFGAGARVHGFQVDYSIRPLASLGAQHRFSGLFRWEGSWLSSVEPMTPLFFQVIESQGEAWASWRAPRASIGEVEVVRVDLADWSEETLGPFARPPVLLTGSVPGALYKVHARGVGTGGRRSLPSNEAYYRLSIPMPEEVAEALPDAEAAATPTPAAEAGPTATPKPVKARPTALPVTTPQVILSAWDPMGLRLEWKPIEGVGESGYQLYRKSPEGMTEKLNHGPLRRTKVWVPKEKGTAGVLIMVSALRADGTELIVGVLACAVPDEWSTALPKSAAVPVEVTGMVDGKPGLEWEPGPKAASFLVLVADPKDRIFQELGRTKGRDPGKVLELLKGAGDSLFVLVSEDKKGSWVTLTQEKEWKNPMP